MTFDAQTLFALLPAVLRTRDAQQAVITPGWLADLAERAAVRVVQAKAAANLPLSDVEKDLLQRALAGPLANLIALLAEQVALLEEDLEQLYDDQFIETCADWVVPYIGDLIGYRTLDSRVPRIASPRAEVAHTVAYRRRKGTVVVLEQLARDVTGWNATTVESFTRLSMTQYMNHLRPDCLATPDLRDWETLERVGGAFDGTMHTVDVRRIESGRGRYNLPNVGVFLWRLDAWTQTCSPAPRADPGDPFRRRFHPLNIDHPLCTWPLTAATVTDLATPLNVPEPISRRVLDAHLGDYYTTPSARRSLRLRTKVGSGACAQFTPLDPADVCICNLADDGATWAHPPKPGKYSIDPELGRIWLPPDVAPGTEVRVDFCYAFSADLGGGEYARDDTFEVDDPPPPRVRVPDDAASVQAALAALPGGFGIVEITDSGRYEETLTLHVPAGQRIEVRAANRCRPTLLLGDEFTLTGEADSEVRLDGLLIAGGGAGCMLRTPAANSALARLRIRHCTLVPGALLATDCTPQFADRPSLIQERVGLAVTIERSIIGALRCMDAASNSVSVSDSIVDATSTERIAYAGVGDDTNAERPGPALTLNACTVFGKLHARALPLVSNSILLATLAAGDSWSAPVLSVRRQQGCVRFSWLPRGARVPRRYQCLPESAPSPAQAMPRFSSLRYGVPAYAQLSTQSGAALLVGADDGSQPGAFHYLYPPQRETNLRVRLDEYLRVGLEAGVFYAT